MPEEEPSGCPTVDRCRRNTRGEEIRETHIDCDGAAAGRAACGASQYRTAHRRRRLEPGTQHPQDPSLLRQARRASFRSRTNHPPMSALSAPAPNRTGTSGRWQDRVQCRCSSFGRTGRRPDFLSLCEIGLAGHSAGQACIRNHGRKPDAVAGSSAPEGPEAQTVVRSRQSERPDVSLT
jgi:hypothetical protein